MRQTGPGATSTAGRAPFQNVHIFAAGPRRTPPPAAPASRTASHSHTLGWVGGGLRVPCISCGLPWPLNCRRVVVRAAGTARRRALCANMLIVGLNRQVLTSKPPVWLPCGLRADRKPGAVRVVLPLRKHGSRGKVTIPVYEAALRRFHHMMAMLVCPRGSRAVLLP
jgi:hypothetical protein